jgi:hypothetical protein
VRAVVWPGPNGRNLRTERSIRYRTSPHCDGCDAGRIYLAAENDRHSVVNCLRELSRNESCQEPALRSGRDAPSSFGRRRRRAAWPPQAGRGTECAEVFRLPRLRHPRQGSSPERQRRVMAAVCRIGLRGSGRHAPRARPEGDAQRSLPFSTRF